jgi:hypothetical protein
MIKIIFPIIVTVIISCTKDEVQLNNSEQTENTSDEIGNSSNDSTSTEGYKIWTGPNMEFKKEANADPKEALSQDRITSSVSITRGSQGEIFNAVLEDKSTKKISPLGTKWAIGDISNIENLTFKTFRNAVGKPNQVVDKKLVLYIEKENVYLRVEFKSWTSGGGGSNGNSSGNGFSYIRSTKN